MKSREILVRPWPGSLFSKFLAFQNFVPAFVKHFHDRRRSSEEPRQKRSYVRRFVKVSMEQPDLFGGSQTVMVRVSVDRVGGAL